MSCANACRLQTTNTGYLLTRLVPATAPHATLSMHHLTHTLRHVLEQPHPRTSLLSPMAMPVCCARCLTMHPGAGRQHVVPVPWSHAPVSEPPSANQQLPGVWATATPPRAAPGPATRHHKRWNPAGATSFIPRITGTLRTDTWHRRA
eukprot:m.674623 g.674623  ORF g.674623 m.674623 type:complete len:148 (-) comp22783_c0_seq71:3518-3961(-)